MTPDEWQEIDQILQAAFERTPAERAAFLSEACEGRPQLRREVVALLDADAAAETFLERPPEIPERLPPRPQPGSRFGAYHLLEEIGYGGFCRVYRARREQPDFKHQVAIKIVDPGLDYGFGDDTGGDISRRFRRERQILAQLDHPSIARLFDGGEVAGRAYFVMEYVDGRPIDAYCAEKRLDLDARLRLMLRAIEAVAYAHEHLIVHRDLKPANLLVSSGGLPKLLDFGIAKALEPETLALSFDATRTGLKPMTPAWAAPEQISGEAVTTATDVYGLGLLLYFLITGERAYELGELTPSQMEREICQRDPAPPSQRLGASTPARPADATPARLEGDLDAIVLTALAKDPKRRYRSVRQLADDLERYLERRPVSARRSTTIERAGLWLRRHRWAALSTLAASAVLAAFITALILQSARLEAERDLARQESQRADQVRQFLVEVFAEADPGRTQGGDLSVRRILDQGMAKVEDLREPAARTELLATLGSVHAGLGQVPEGAELLRRARLEAVELYGGEHARVADIDHRLGQVLLSSDRFESAERAIRSALELRRATLGDEHPETAASLGLLGRLRFYQGFWAEADETITRAVELLEQTGPPDEPHIQLLGELASARYLNGRPEDFLPLLEKRLQLTREHLGESHPLYAGTLAELSAAESTPDAALAKAREALELQKRVLDEDHPKIAGMTRMIAHRLASTDPEKALELARQAYEIDNRVWGEGTWTQSLNHAVLTRIYSVIGQLEKADDHSRKAVEDARSGTPKTHPWRMRVISARLAFLLANQDGLDQDGPDRGGPDRGGPDRDGPDRDGPVDPSPLEEAAALTAELTELHGQLPRQNLPLAKALPAVEALVAYHRGEEGATETLLELGPAALETLARHEIGAVMQSSLETIQQSRSARGGDL